MVKATKQNDKLNRAVIVSGALHLILIVLLIWGTLRENIMSASAGDGDSSVIGAVMINPNSVVEQYDRQQQQTNDAPRTEKLQQKKAQQQVKELQQKQAAEQQKALAEAKEKKKLADVSAAQAKADVSAAQAKAEADKLTLVQAEAQQKDKARKRAEEAKNAAEQKSAVQTKKQAAAAKQSAEVDDLFDSLSDNKPKGQGNAKSRETNTVDINGYIGQIQGAIQSKFYDPVLFTGKTCELRIKLAPDGLMISVQEVGGDPALCQAAVSAAKLAQIPKPPSDGVYQHVKHFTLGFKPQ